MPPLKRKVGFGSNVHRFKAQKKLYNFKSMSADDDAMKKSFTFSHSDHTRGGYAPYMDETFSFS